MRVWDTELVGVKDREYGHLKYSYIMHCAQSCWGVIKKFLKNIPHSKKEEKKEKKNCEQERKNKLVYTHPNLKQLTVHTTSW